MLIIFLHLFFYYFVIYNFYIFILLNIFYYVFTCINKHIKDNKITESNNIFLQPFIYSNKSSSNYLYYLDIKLSKYRIYEQYKDKFISLSNQFSEFCNLALHLVERNLREMIMTTVTPTPQDIMKMLPMMLAQKKQMPTIDVKKNNISLDLHSDVQMNIKPKIDMDRQKNPLLYDSDHEIPEDLEVD